METFPDKKTNSNSAKRNTSKKILFFKKETIKNNLPLVIACAIFAIGVIFTVSTFVWDFEPFGIFGGGGGRANTNRGAGEEYIEDERTLAIATNWSIHHLDDDIAIPFTFGNTPGLMMIGTMPSHPEYPALANLALVSSIILTQVDGGESNAYIIANYPAIRHSYELTVGDVRYDIVGFLLPNGFELVYIQFGVPTTHDFCGRLYEEVTAIIQGLDPLPSQFPTGE